MLQISTLHKSLLPQRFRSIRSVVIEHLLYITDSRGPFVSACRLLSEMVDLKELNLYIHSSCLRSCLIEGVMVPLCQSLPCAKFMVTVITGEKNIWERWQQSFADSVFFDLKVVFRGPKLSPPDYCHIEYHA